LTFENFSGMVISPEIVYQAADSADHFRDQAAGIYG
jgi:hypothetical protein